VAVPPAPDASSGVTEDDSHPVQDSSAPLFRRGLLGVLLVLLVASIAAAGYLATNRSVPALGIEGEQESLQAQRDQVEAQAEQFLLRVNTYDPSMLDSDGTMPKYRQLVEEVITPKFAADFDQSVTVVEQVVQGRGDTVTCEVFSTGVSAIDSDSATALVAGATTNTIPGKDGEAPKTNSQPLQLRLEMVKIQGKWLVDDFSSISGTGDPAPDDSPSPSPSSSPSQTPTEGATP
jgi:Mce-associated membrane protein